MLKIVTTELRYAHDDGRERGGQGKSVQLMGLDARLSKVDPQTLRLYGWTALEILEDPDFTSPDGKVDGAGLRRSIAGPAGAETVGEIQRLGQLRDELLWSSFLAIRPGEP